jgi:trehalose/maltose transport system substrate-binding protein
MSSLPHILTAVCLLLMGSAPAWAADLSLVCGRDARETRLCRGAAEDWAARTGNQVRVFAAPPDPARRLIRYQELLEVGAAEPDVLEIDALWCGRLAGHLADLRPLIGGAETAFLPALIGNATAHGRLVALPWSLELGLLYYRSDLLARYRLPVPRTWAELADTAQRLQEAQRFSVTPGSGACCGPVGRTKT